MTVLSFWSEMRWSEMQWAEKGVTNARAYIMHASYEIIDKNVWESKQRYNGKKRHELSCQSNIMCTVHCTLYTVQCTMHIILDWQLSSCRFFPVISLFTFPHIFVYYLIRDQKVRTVMVRVRGLG